ncbi:hypothetical protein TYRP_001378 [Tyrophagus putrescentiae]|nr:hypothetical protein TYRP_001378 [Tyrophagus putrescentiae]
MRRLNAMRAMSAVFTLLIVLPLCSSLLNVPTNFAVHGAPLEATLTPSSAAVSVPVDGLNRELNSTTILSPSSSENVTSSANPLDTIAYSVSIDDFHHLPHPNESDQDWSYDRILFFTISFDFSCVLRALIFIYCCLVIGYLCDEYFVPSLEDIGEALKFSPDLIGAILIPFGTSGPEIFSSAVGVFFAKNDIGTGAIIGSSVFNMLAIPAACGLAAVYFTGNKIQLEEMSILRDMVFYIVSVVVLILVVKDKTVDLLDSSLLILLFVVYIAVMLYNCKFSKSLTSPPSEGKDLEKSSKKSKKENSKSQNNNGDVSYQTTKMSSGGKYKMKEYLNKCQEIMSGEAKESIVNFLYSQKVEETKALLKSNHKCDKANGIEAKLYAFIEDITRKEEDENDRSRVSSKKGDYEKLSDDECNGFGFTENCILRWILMPFTLLFFLTLPRRFSAVTFFLSIAWLSALSYVTVWSISGLSDYLGIPPTVSGMTILAAGSAVPDLVTSIIVIKKTKAASMGISAAIASNIFAILLGLGLPWTIRILLNWAEGSPFAASYIILESDALPYTSIILLGTIFALYFVFRFCDWAISTRFALICMSIHVLFIASNIVLEIVISANS